MKSASRSSGYAPAGNSLIGAGWNEVTAFLSPLTKFGGAAWLRIHVMIFGVGALYALSGVTIIEANEAGLVLRFGAITRTAGEPIVHPPGILYALPAPFDEVLKVEVDRVDTITIDELAPLSWRTDPQEAEESSTIRESDSMDSRDYGYVLTGDRNILHSQIIVRYRVSDPVGFSLLTSTHKSFLRATILESTVRMAGATRLDDLLGGGRDRFASDVAASAQGRLDRIGSGLEVVSIEFENLSPPEQVAADFDAVQSAYIEAQTRKQDARSYAAEAVPSAKASARETISQAESTSSTQVSRARADTKAFAALLPSYWANPALVRQRLYQESVEQALDSVARLRFVPAPVASDYRGARFSISPPNNWSIVHNGTSTKASPTATGDTE